MRKGNLRLVFPLMILVLALAVSGCGVNHKTAAGVVESLVKAYAEGKEKQVKECYGLTEEADDSLQKEIDATMKYFQAHEVSKVQVNSCTVLSDQAKYSYVCIIYNLVLKDEQEYPCISTYMVKKNEDKTYSILATSEITEDMSKQAAADYAKFMTTQAYKNYNKTYNTFLKKNPGYEEKIANKLS